MNHKHLLVAALVVLALGLSVFAVDAQGPKGGPKKPAALAGTGFTYQGQLKNGGALVNSTCEFNFGLWDDVGAQVGNTQTVPSAVTNGLFTVQLNSSGQITTGTAFNGDARYLGLSVKCTGDGGVTALNPRQQLTPAPMAFALPGLYTQQNSISPNVIGGYSGNVITPTLYGATISGGGLSAFPNRVWANYATVGGGASNTASGDAATIGGGYNNAVSSFVATVGGGTQNSANGSYATVPGGLSNSATMSYTLAAGRRAKANHDGAFVWADSTDANFASTANNQFLIRAGGGMGVGTNNTLAAFQVAKDVVDTNSYGQIEAIGATNNAKRLSLGFDTTSNIGWIQASETFVAYRNIALNPNNGNVLIGTTSDPGDKLNVLGDIRIGTSGTNGCIKRFDGTTLSGACSSDARLKKNIEAFPLMLNQVSRLQPVHYQWRAEEFPQYGFAANTTSYGLIAQEVERVLPELVGQDERGYKTVNYSELPLMLLQALKELRTEKDEQITTQQNEIAQLKKQNTDFESRLAALEQACSSARTQSNDPNLVLAFVLGAIGVAAIARKSEGESR